jgi:hypothetical protein
MVPSSDPVPPALADSAPDVRERLQSSIVLLLMLGLFLALPFVLSIGSVVFLPPVTAMIFTIVLSPLADRMIRIGLPNMLASMLAILLMIVAALTLILQPAFDMVDQVPAMVREVSRRFAEIRDNLSWVNDINRQLARLAGHSPREVALATPSVIEQVAIATPSVLLETLLTILMTFFMIESRVRMKRRLLLERASFTASVRIARVLRDVQDRVASYILTVAQINFGVGLVVAAVDLRPCRADHVGRPCLRAQFPALSRPAGDGWAAGAHRAWHGQHGGMGPCARAGVPCASCHRIERGHAFDPWRALHAQPGLHPDFVQLFHMDLGRAGRAALGAHPAHAFGAGRSPRPPEHRRLPVWRTAVRTRPHRSGRGRGGSNKPHLIPLSP